MGSVYRRGRAWWIKFYRNGKPIRESAATRKESEARRLLKRREGEVEEGKPYVPRVTRLRLEELLDEVLTDYRINGKRSLRRAALSVSHLTAYFGPRRAVDVGTAAIRHYIAHRQEGGAANATINHTCSPTSRAASAGSASKTSGGRGPRPAARRAPRGCCGMISGGRRSGTWSTAWSPSASPWRSRATRPGRCSTATTS